MAKISRIAILAMLFSLASFCKAQTLITPDNDKLVYVGRVCTANPSAYTWSYPGVQIHAVVEGTSTVSIRTKAKCGDFMVEIDDREPYKIKVGEGSGTGLNLAETLVAKNLDKGQHRLTLTYVVEGLTLKPVFYGLLLEREGRLAEQLPQLPERKIEFIGNSITCSLGIEYPEPGNPKSSFANENQYYSYEAIACRELNAQCFVVARSGIGVYRNSGGKPAGDKDVLPAYYPYTHFQLGGDRWDFSRFTPDVVCINLGTNDTSNPSYSVDLLAKGYDNFLKTIRGNYPNAKIVLLTGTMRVGQRLADMKTAQKRAIEWANQRGDNDIYRLDFTPADGSLGYGQYKHPSARQHQQMARELIPFLKKIMNWD